jgi:hypothetical protein
VACVDLSAHRKARRARRRRRTEPDQPAEAEAEKDERAMQKGEGGRASCAKRCEWRHGVWQEAHWHWRIALHNNKRAPVTMSEERENHKARSERRTGGRHGRGLC